MKLHITHIFAVISLVPIAATAVAADRLVPSQYLTIQAAIDAAVNGDTVIVAAGEYQESIRFNGRAITVRSSSGADLTTIEKPPTGPSSPTVTFSDAESNSSILDGFTIRGGTGLFTPIWVSDGYQFGGGVYSSNASPLVRNCIITDNHCGTYHSRGGGIYVSGGAPRFEHCDITANSANGGYGSGGGIHVAAGAPAFLDCTIKGNSVSSYHSGNCGGLAVAGGSPTMINCRITGNSASGGVGGMCVGSSTTLERVYVGSANGSTLYAGDFADGGGNDLDGDCNDNGTADATDIASGYSDDSDGDGMPDECRCRHYPAIICCPADITGNSAVDGVDLSALIGAWGTDGSGGEFDADITNDSIVDGADLAIMLSGWGVCPN
jgi:hypothetical protein